MPIVDQPANAPAVLALFLVVVGACWGSFAATLSERWPAGRSIVRPRSRCDSCDAALGARDLIPLFSYLVSRGRCRSCGSVIPLRYPMVEAACAAIGLVAALFLPLPNAFWIALFGWQLLLLAILDAEHFWLPDPLVGCLALTGIVAAIVAGGSAVGEALIGGAVGFASLAAVALMYKRLRGRTGMGGGDPKLFGAIGIWTGWQALPVILLAAALVGMVAVLFLAIRGPTGEPLHLRRIPFGTCLAICGWVYCLSAMVNPSIMPAIPVSSYF